MASKPEPEQPDLIDRTSQRATEHNVKAWNKELDEAGFSEIVCRALSQFTMVMHDRTLAPEEREAFRAWVDDQKPVERVCSDPDGTVYRVHI